MGRLCVALCLLWPSIAEASWSYDWYCNGTCATGELSVKGHEGPFATEEACEAARQSDPWNQTVREPGNFGNVDACHEDGGGSQSGSSNTGPVAAHQRFRPEIRVLAGMRMVAFDNHVTSTATMAGQPPDVVAASGAVDPGWIVALQLSGRNPLAPYVELSYFRNGVASQGVRIAGNTGGWLTLGVSRSKRLFGRTIVEGQVGGGVAFVNYTPSAQNPETERHNNLSYVAEASIVLGMHPFKRSPRLELRTSVCLLDPTYTPTAYSSDAPNIELGRLGLLFIAGLAFF